MWHRPQNSVFLQQSCLPENWESRTLADQRKSLQPRQIVGNFPEGVAELFLIRVVHLAVRSVGRLFDFAGKIVHGLRTNQSDTVFLEKWFNMLVDFIRLLGRFLRRNNDQPLSLAINWMFLNQIPIDRELCCLRFGTSAGRKHVRFDEIHHSIFVRIRNVQLSLIDWNSDCARLPDLEFLLQSEEHFAQPWWQHFCR